MAHHEDGGASCKMNSRSDGSSCYLPDLEINLWPIDALEREVQFRLSFLLQF